ILQAARDRGALVVASAGNFPEERDQYPAAFPPVLAVSAVDLNGTKIQEASYGGFVDLMAPGLDIRSASAEDDTTESSHDGTSMAAAIVAAAAAVVKVQHPGISSE